MNYGDDPAFNRQHNLEGFIAMVSGRGARDPRCACDTRLPLQSKDGGVTWTNTTAVGAFSGRLAAPVFVSCGQANAPCAGLGFLYGGFSRNRCGWPGVVVPLVASSCRSLRRILGRLYL